MSLGGDKDWDCELEGDVIQFKHIFVAYLYQKLSIVPNNALSMLLIFGLYNAWSELITSNG